MSASCQKQPHAVQQNCGYVINDMYILERIRMGDTSPAVAMFSSRKLALRADLGKLPSLCTLLTRTAASGRIRFYTGACGPHCPAGSYAFSLIATTSCVLGAAAAGSISTIISIRT